MPIDVGTQAPDFTLKTQDEKEWKLSSQKGKNVVLLFYPLDWSPTCEKENCKLSENAPVQLPKDTVLVGVSRDSTWSHKAWKQAKGIKHELLADPTLDVASKFGLKNPAVQFISHRASVVVDKAGKVAFVQVQENTKEERNWAELSAALKKLS